jgi:hypothetical protein
MMKKVIYMVGFLITTSILSFKIYASTPPSDKHEFKNKDREINFDIERKSGEISLYFQSEVFNQYDQILVERCGSDNGNYSVCKTIDLAQVKVPEGYYKTNDKYPLNAQKDCYYRLKTVAKDGSMKTFPPVLLTALTK